MEEIIRIIKDGHKNEDDRINSYRKRLGGKYSILFLIIEVLSFILFSVSAILNSYMPNDCLLYISIISLYVMYAMFFLVMIVSVLYLIGSIVNNHPFEMMTLRIKSYADTIDALSKVNVHDLWSAYQLFSIEVSQLENRVPIFKINKIYVLVLYAAILIIPGISYAEIDVLNIKTVIEISGMDGRILFASASMVLVILLSSLIWMQRMRCHVFVLKMALILRRGGELPLDMGKMIDPTFS